MSSVVSLVYESPVLNGLTAKEVKEFLIKWRSYIRSVENHNNGIHASRQITPADLTSCIKDYVLKVIASRLDEAKSWEELEDEEVEQYLKMRVKKLTMLAENQNLGEAN